MVIDAYFTNTVSRVGGIGLKEIDEGDAMCRHDQAFDPLGLGVDTTLDSIRRFTNTAGRKGGAPVQSPMTIDRPAAGYADRGL